MTMNLEDLKAQILGLKSKEMEGGFAPQTPLREFWGTLHVGEPAFDTRFQSSEKGPSVKFSLMFEDITVIETEDVYPYPQAELSFTFSKRSKSRWGVVVESLAKILGEDTAIGDVEGHRVRMKLVGGHVLYSFQESKDTEQQAWEIIEVEGASAAGAPVAGVATANVSPVAAAVQVLLGKTDQEFAQQVFQDPRVRVDQNLINEILTQKFVAKLVSDGLVVKGPDGRYQVGDPVKIMAL